MTNAVTHDELDDFRALLINIVARSYSRRQLALALGGTEGFVSAALGRASLADLVALVEEAHDMKLSAERVRARPRG